jgi:hypothetical protein
MQVFHMHACTVLYDKTGEGGGEEGWLDVCWRSSSKFGCFLLLKHVKIEGGHQAGLYRAHR